MENTINTIILGAGISGLIIAYELKKKNIDFLILEKSHTIGGRIATRNIEQSVYDHGAQFFTVKSDYVKQLNSEMLEKNISKAWDQEISQHTKYIGSKKIKDLPKYIAKNLDIRLNEKITKLDLIDDLWKLLSESGKIYYTKELIITFPVPQAINLIDSGNYQLKNETMDLKNIKYDKCIALLAEFENSNLPKSGYIKIKDHDIVEWIADNYQKGISPIKNTLTIHTTPQFSLDNWDKSNIEITEKIIESVENYVSKKYINSNVKKWGLSKPINHYKENYIVLESNPFLALAGDGFGGGRVESAILSGLELVKKMGK